MLARANRLVTADDYRRLVRRGRRISMRHVVVYVNKSSSSDVPKFGFIVAKTVGIAVKRNLVRRQLKAICFEQVASLDTGFEIVIRALPGAADAGWTKLHSEIYRSLSGALEL